MSLTRTAATTAAYARRAFALRRAAAAAYGIGEEELSDEAFASWLVTCKPDWSRSTWRQYISACTSVLGPPFRLLIDQSELPPSASHIKRTSALKAKTASPNDLAHLIVHLLRNEPDHLERAPEAMSGNVFTAHLLVGGVLYGLRPAEWATAQLQYGQMGYELVVKNSKATNGRAHGYHRRLCLGHVGELEELVLWNLVRVVRHLVAQDAFDRHLANARRLITRTTRALWPRRKQHITLYTMRHQCAANLKAALPPAAVAAILGHKTTATAANHYAKRRQAQAEYLPNQAVPVVHPHCEDVTRVRIDEGRTQREMSAEAKAHWLGPELT